MLSLTKDSQIDKVKKTFSELLSYLDEVIRDERLRADIRAAAGHGAKASDRVKKDLAGGSMAASLAADNKLRKNIRAMLDDLDSAGDRMRRKRTHRARNLVLMVVGGVAALSAIPRVRIWLAERTSDVPVHLQQPV